MTPRHRLRRRRTAARTLALTAALALVPTTIAAVAAPTIAAVAAPTATTRGPAATSSAHPVPPAVTRLALSGVDRAALAQAPAALDPTALRRADAAQPTVTTRATSLTRPVVFTAALSLKAFTAVGLSWTAASAPSGPVVQIRVRDRGVWGEWTQLDLAAGPDPTTREGRAAAGRVSTEPYSTPSGDAVQVRVDTSDGRAPRDLRLTSVDPGTSAADTAMTPMATAATSTVTAPVGQPVIYSRAAWGADDSLLAVHGPCPGLNETQKVAFVHHTVGSNTYTAAQTASIIRGIYAYHVQGNGWCDIGYQFLVDRFGRIYEGRHGGIAAPVQGAQTLAFNTDTFGVAAMGTFSSVAAPKAMTDGIYAVVGWKLGLYGRNPLGTDTLVSAGGTGAKYPAGTTVRFNVVSGHRDGYATECPGNALYAQLPAIRRDASTWIATHSPAATPISGTLASGASVTSPNGGFRLVMQTDGNLVMYSGGSHVHWNSHTFVPGSSLQLQSDGNLVMYSPDHKPVWSPLTVGAHHTLLLQDDGRLVLYDADKAALWDSSGRFGRAYALYPERVVPSLASGASVLSTNGLLQLIMQTDGNLVLYRSGVALWSTGTRVAGSRLAAQTDGNLVVYTPSTKAVWSAGVQSPNAVTRLQNDGDLVIYSTAGVPLWHR